MTKELIILCGIPFAGKSILAQAISQQFGYERIDLDEVKFQMFGRDIKDEQIDQSGWDKIYQQMYHEIDETLSQNKSVVHDTGNFTVYERGLINQIAKKRSVPFRTVFIDIPVEIARERLRKNRQSQARFDVSDKSFEDAVAEMEKPIENENPLIFPYQANLEEWLQAHFALGNN